MFREEHVPYWRPNNATGPVRAYIICHAGATLGNFTCHVAIYHGILTTARGETNAIRWVYVYVCVCVWVFDVFRWMRDAVILRFEKKQKNSSPNQSVFVNIYYIDIYFPSSKPICAKLIMYNGSGCKNASPASFVKDQFLACKIFSQGFETHCGNSQKPRNLIIIIYYYLRKKVYEKSNVAENIVYVVHGLI